MCPDRSTLSAFYDGELEGDIRRSVSEHVSQCDSCRAAMIGFRGISESLVVSMPIEVDAIASRSKAHVLARARMAPDGAVWRRNLNIPAPIAAVAAALIVVLFVGLVFSLQRSGTPMVAARSEAKGTPLEEIVRYLDARQQQKPVVFRLPEDARLRVVSEPTFVRADEYQPSIK